MHHSLQISRTPRQGLWYLALLATLGLMLLASAHECVLCGHESVTTSATPASDGSADLVSTRTQQVGLFAYRGIVAVGCHRLFESSIVPKTLHSSPPPTSSNIQRFICGSLHHTIAFFMDESPLDRWMSGPFNYNLKLGDWSTEPGDETIGVQIPLWMPLCLLTVAPLIRGVFLRIRTRSTLLPGMYYWIACALGGLLLLASCRQCMFMGYESAQLTSAAETWGGVTVDHPEVIKQRGLFAFEGNVALGFQSYEQDPSLVSNVGTDSSIDLLRGSHFRCSVTDIDLVTWPVGPACACGLAVGHLLLPGPPAIYFNRIRLPLWMPIALLIARLGFLFYRNRRHSLANQAGKCVRCNYDLRFSPERCPECGSTVGPRTATKQGRILTPPG